MSLLDLCPRGSLLEPVQEAVTDTDWSPFAKQLYEGLTVPQREVWDDECRFKLLCSGRRFGKTYLCISRLVAWAIERPGTLNWYVTQNYKSAKQIAWRQLKIMVPARDVRQEERIRTVS